MLQYYDNSNIEFLLSSCCENTRKIREKMELRFLPMIQLSSHEMRI